MATLKLEVTFIFAFVVGVVFGYHLGYTGVLAQMVCCGDRTQVSACESVTFEPRWKTCQDSPEKSA